LELVKAKKATEMDILPFTPSIFTITLSLLISLTIYHESAFVLYKSSSTNTPPKPTPVPSDQPTTLQQHVLFWDRDQDSIIYPRDVYSGFRSLGFSIPFSLASLLIPVFFAYPTRLAHSYIPDPLFRIYVSSIHKAKHGSDTGIYQLDGSFDLARFEDLFVRFDSKGKGGLGAKDLWRLWGSNRVAADPAGWMFAAMEWSTTWILLQ
jgi:peroxygenase